VANDSQTPPPGDPGGRRKRGSSLRAPSEPSAKSDDGVPEPVADQHTGGAGQSARMRMARSAKRATSKIEDVVGGGVSRLGGGLESLGEGIGQLGERVEKVPLIGQGVKDLGGGLADIGESLHDLPSVAKTPSGRALIASMLVGFLLVFAWISFIVWFQLRGGMQPDFRPMAEKILVDLRDGKAATIYADCSPRMQETIREERFVATINDMNKTLGKFVEIAAINETFVTSGPQGRIGRVSMTVEFENARTLGSVSFQKIDKKWKLLGIAMEVPKDVPISTNQEEQYNLPPELVPLGTEVLKLSSQSADDEIWQRATESFRERGGRDAFVALQQTRRDTLGKFVRVLVVQEKLALSYDKLSASFVALCQYERANASATIGFDRRREDTPWQMSSLKIVLPLVRPDETRAPATKGSAGASAPAPVKPAAP